MERTIHDQREIINRKICTELIIQYNKHYDDIRGFLKEWQISVGQYEILGNIAKYNGITQKELTKELIIAKANVGQSLFKLKMSKMIFYEKKLNKQHIYITHLGRKILNELQVHDKCFYEKRYINLTDSEREDFYKLLKLVNKSI